MRVRPARAETCAWQGRVVRIAIDAMGGDHAPDAILAGCLDALDLLDPGVEGDRLVLVGDEHIIREHLTERGRDRDPRIERGMLIPTRINHPERPTNSFSD